MSDLMPDFKDLSPYKKRLELIRLTAEQVIKDFGLHGFEVEFSGNEDFAYDELFMQIKPLIEHLMEKNPTKLSSLLYSIDLNETKVRRILAGNADNPAEELTAMVLERELQKVVIRSYFSMRDKE